MIDLQESDWKYMKSLKKTLLDRLCNRILDTIQAECSTGKREPDVHQQYLKVYSLIQKFDKTVGECFDDWRRSNLYFHILFLVKHKVITDDEIAQLSNETQERIRFHFNH